MLRSIDVVIKQNRPGYVITVKHLVHRPIYVHVYELGWIIDKVGHPYSKITSCPTEQGEYSVHCI